MWLRPKPKLPCPRCEGQALNMKKEQAFGLPVAYLKIHNNFNVYSGLLERDSTIFIITLSISFMP